MEIGELRTALCRSLCGSFEVNELANGVLAVDTEFFFPDGDGYSLYLTPTPTGYVISDRGHTLMQLSYYMDVAALRAGNRRSLFERCLAAREAREEDGVILVETRSDDLGSAVVRFSQLVTEIRALEFLSRTRVENTFFDDLKTAIGEAISMDRVSEGYVVPGLPDAENYTVDYYIPGKSAPLYLFGVHSKDKARLTTIVLQHLVGHEHEFDSILVFRDQTEIPAADLARLSNVGGEQVASLSAREDLARKIRRRAA